MISEIWKDVLIVGFEGIYQVSDAGRVKSLRRTVTHSHSGTMTIPERILKPNAVAFGYQQVTLNNFGKRKSVYVHVLVMAAFVGEKEKGYEVNHIDEDKTNNALSNLEYLTSKDNNNYGNRIRLVVEKNTNGKKSKPVVGTCLKTGKRIEFPSTAEARRRGFGSHISDVLHGKRKHCHGYFWEFL
jgi:hypothetical protein